MRHKTDLLGMSVGRDLHRPRLQKYLSTWWSLMRGQLTERHSFACVDIYQFSFLQAFVIIVILPKMEIDIDDDVRGHNWDPTGTTHITSRSILDNSLNNNRSTLYSPTPISFNTLFSHSYHYLYRHFYLRLQKCRDCESTS